MTQHIVKASIYRAEDRMRVAHAQKTGTDIGLGILGMIGAESEVLHEHVLRTMLRILPELLLPGDGNNVGFYGRTIGNICPGLYLLAVYTWSPPLEPGLVVKKLGTITFFA